MPRRGQTDCLGPLCIHLSTSFLSFSNSTIPHNRIKNEACGWISQSSHLNVETNIKLLTYEKEQIKEENPISLKMEELWLEWEESGNWDGVSLGNQLEKRSALMMSMLVKFLERL